MNAKHAIAAAAAVLLLSACTHEPPAKRYPLSGQVLGINAAQHELVIKHNDIPGLMPAMTMSYPVADPALLEGRTPGELISATLEVKNSIGRLVSITHTGSAPLPDAAETALATETLNVGDQAPNLAFVDQDNRHRTFDEWKGTPTVLTFIYTRCPLPTYCPLMDQNFETLQGQLADDSTLHGRVKLVTVSFDPEYDTPQVLKAHAAKLSADPAVWTFLTGAPATIDQFTATFGVGVLRDPKDPAQITHNLRTFLLDANERIVKVYSGNGWTPGIVLADLRKAVSH